MTTQIEAGKVVAGTTGAGESERKISLRVERRVRDEITAAGDDVDEEQIAEWFRAVFGRAPSEEDSDPYSLVCAAVGATE